MFSVHYKTLKRKLKKQKLIELCSISREQDGYSASEEQEQLRRNLIYRFLSEDRIVTRIDFLGTTVKKMQNP